MTTPAWSAPINGLPGNLRANLGSAHLNQLLGAHGIQPVYEGAKVISASGGTQLTWLPMPASLDFSQPITMSGTAMGRIQVPLLPYGNGTDVLVQMWPDNGSGAPNTSGNPIAATLLPAGYINQVAAVNGLENPPSTLATEKDNEYGNTNSVVTVPYPVPAGDSSGAISNPVLTTTTDTMLYLGGYNHGGATRLANVASSTYANGTLAQPVPQPSLPESLAFGCAAVVNQSTVVYAGGFNTSNTLVADVWAASWTSSSHTVGAWSAQTALPVALSATAATSWNNTIYVIGGANASNVAVSTVYTATVTNGQISSWQTSQPLPAAICYAFAAACAGWLFVMGGVTVPGSTTGLQAMYYAKINADGSLGPWQTGPSMPTGAYAVAAGWGVFATSNCVFQVSGHGSPFGDIQALPVTANGPASFWYVTNWANNGDLPLLPFQLGNGQWQMLSPVIDAPSSILQYSTLVPMPYISVPLYATGLTNGATYHVLLRASAPSSASDGVQLGTLDDTALPAITLQSSRYAGSWSHIPSGWSVPLRVYDASATGGLRHLLQDPVNGMAQSWSSVFYNGQKLLAGVADVTMHPNVPLNANPTFTSGVTPWTAVNGTVTQSSAQVHGGFAFSGLLTPTGGFTQAYALSELIPVTQTPYGAAQWLLVNGWFYTPTTWSAFDLSVFWFDQSGAFISSSDLNTSLTGATWTQESHYVTPPATTASARILPILNGSPTSAQLLYMSNVQLLLAPECVGAMTSAATVNYGTNPWPPTGVSQLL